MKTVQFDPDKDFDRLEGYLRDRYLESCEATSWLPERLHDLIYTDRDSIPEGARQDL